MSRRSLEALELFDESKKPGLPLQSRRLRQVLMAHEEPHELLRRDRSNLSAQAIERQPVNPREQPSIAPFQLYFGSEATAEHGSLHLQRRERQSNLGRFQSQRRGQRAGVSWPDTFHPAAH